MAFRCLGSTSLAFKEGIELPLDIFLGARQIVELLTQGSNTLCLARGCRSHRASQLLNLGFKQTQ